MVTRPGKRLHNELENHHAINGYINYFYGHFPYIYMFTRGYSKSQSVGFNMFRSALSGIVYRVVAWVYLRWLVFRFCMVLFFTNSLGHGKEILPPPCCTSADRRGIFRDGKSWSSTVERRWPPCRCWEISFSLASCVSWLGLGAAFRAARLPWLTTEFPKFDRFDPRLAPIRPKWCGKLCNSKIEKGVPL